MNKIIDKIYYSDFFSSIFRTTVFCLKKELKGCETVLDLGCGPSSPLKFCKSVKYSVGVETFGPSLEESRRRNIHTKYLEKKVEDVDFPENSFDAVIMIEVLEHLPQDLGYALLKKSEKWAKKKVIISTPNGFLFQQALDGNPFQKHLSGWDIEMMEKMGFRCQGLAGFKWFHQKIQLLPQKGTKNDFSASIRFRPRLFWFALATLSQLIAYSFPAGAFEIFCIKEIK